MNKDEYFMMMAIKEAEIAYEKNEVPVGCIIVFEGNIIAKAHNQVELLKDATAHAEMLALTVASSYMNNFRLLNTTMYTTLEPCIMCAGAIINSRVSRLVYGAKDIRVGSHGSFINVFEKKHPIHNLEITGGILEENSSNILKKFFEKQRKKTKI
ncbi:MAG: tRNA-specific adenosine deaminase [Candidatus Anoxychlamydiales bacterium]|nr:tRNA-specific adenosine deaminase [Candidatus Anoxychlamydiales bacterium]